MGDIDERDAELALQLGEFTLHADDEVGIEGGQGFVEQQDLRFGNKGAGKGDALALAAGKLVDRALGKVGKSHAIEPVEGLVAASSAVLPRAS